MKPSRVNAIFEVDDAADRIMRKLDELADYNPTLAMHTRDFLYAALSLRIAEERFGRRTQRGLSPKRLESAARLRDKAVQQVRQALAAAPAHVREVMVESLQRNGLAPWAVRH